MTLRTAETLRDTVLIFLSAVLLGVGFNSMSPLSVRPAAAQPPPTKSPSGPTSVTWPQARVLLENGAVLVDARERDAYEFEHINDAVSLPMDSFDEEIVAFKSRTPANSVIIIYCSSSQCTYSRTMAQLLMQKHGFTDVRDMPGGYEEWRLAIYATK